MKQRNSSLRIILTEDGVHRVQLCGESWDDEPEADRLYSKVSHLINEMHRILKDQGLEQPEISEERLM